MPHLSPYEVNAFDVTTKYTRVIWDVRRLVTGRVQVIDGITTLSTGAIKVEYSNDGLTWVAFSPAVSFSAAGISSDLGLSDIDYLTAYVDTAQSSVVCKLLLSGKNDATVGA